MVYERHALAAVMLLVTPQGIPLVLKPSKLKPKPWYWRLPGGKSEKVRASDGSCRDETPEECVIRKLSQEIGVRLDASNLKPIHSEKRQDHVFFVFRVDLPRLPELLETGKGGEEVRVFQPEEILMLPKFMSAHKLVIENILMELVAKAYTS